MNNFKDYLNKINDNNIEQYLKKSNQIRDKFELELLKFLNKKHFEKAKKRAEQLKYPPTTVYEKYLNSNIL